MGEVSKLFRPKTVGLAYTMARNAGQGRGAALATAGRQAGDQAKREIPRTYKRVRDNATTTQKVAAATVGGVGLGSYLTKSGDSTVGDPFQISKAAERPMTEYRPSVWEPLNPRSKTKVRRGTSVRRGGRVALGNVGGSYLGAMGGSIAGKALSHGSPIGTQVGTGLGGTIGGALGWSAGRTGNLRSGDTVMVRRKDGAKAKAVISTSGITPDFAVYRRKKAKG